MTKIIFEIRKNTYYDSVTLMLISKEVEKIQGVYEALVGMGTELNKELAENLKISNDEIRSIGPNDFFVSVLGDDDVSIENINDEINRFFNEKKKDRDSSYTPPSLDSALRHEPDSNLALISVAGEYAVSEARKALESNLHVMVFSDNVSLKDERELKELAVDRGLLMMGPDCGTAIINNIPLAFANVVNKGDIGIIGASGTGIQEVSVIIHKLGRGLSQVIGTGGRDLHEEIGGLMMLEGIQALNNDPNTKVIVLISKPPSENVANKIFKNLRNIDKPVLINFIGGDRKSIEKSGACAGISLEDTARKAVALSKGIDVEDFNGFSLPNEEIDKIVERQVSKKGKTFRGLFTGGTLAAEARDILGEDHICIDFGEDEFTLGKPHPMIDPSTRNGHLHSLIRYEEVGIILMDFVLGYGAHENPIGDTLPILKEAKDICIVASICGTDKDPQDIVETKKKLEEVGVIVMPTNAQAARLVGLMLNREEEESV